MFVFLISFMKVIEGILSVSKLSKMKFYVSFGLSSSKFEIFHVFHTWDGLAVFPTNGGVHVANGLPSCLFGIGGGPPSAPSCFPANCSVPVFCWSPSLTEEVLVPEVGIFEDVFEGLVDVAVVLLVDELVTMLIPGWDGGPSPVTWRNRVTEVMEY